MSLESGKTLGGIGALLIAIGSFVPFLGLAGIILLLVAMKRIAEHYNDNSIFQNALYGFIFGIIGIVAAAIVIVTVIFGLAVIQPIPDPGVTGPLAFLGGIIVALIVGFIFYLLHAIYYRRAFDSLSEKTQEKMFGTAGLLLVIGAVLTIVIIGLLLMLIAWILVAAAFFSIKTSAAKTFPPEPPPPPPL